MMYKILVLLFFLSVQTYAQTSEDQYRVRLDTVLKEIEERFQVTLSYPDDLVNDRWVTYAGWRFKNDVEETLKNVLSSQDLSFTRAGENKYKIKQFEYWRKTPEEGREQLTFLGSLYNNVTSWEKRKQQMRSCMFDALGLTRLPVAPVSKPIITEKRKMNGYTVENIAIETLPGVFVSGSLYRPLKQKGKLPVILCPNGHFGKGRYRDDQQYRCAMLARMGAIAISYDLFAWGESLLQFKTEDHRRSLAMTMQALNGIRILDYLLSLKEVDPDRVGITGASGGGSQTMLLTALDDRIKVSVPVVMLSSYFSGGCPCESGRPVHLCGGGTNNAEIAGMAAPRPQLIISDGKDWSAHVPEMEYPFLQKIYAYYAKTDLVKNVHFPEEGHDYGFSKRIAMYSFMAKHLNLNLKAIQNKSGGADESTVTIEDESDLYVFGKTGARLPSHAVTSFSALEKYFRDNIKSQGR
jgi:hypothetical protein